MKTSIDTLDCMWGSLESGNLYCIGCTARVKRIKFLANVAVGVLTKQSGLALISLDYSRSEMTDALRESYRASNAASAGKLSLWLEHQPITTYSLIQDTLQRIVCRDKKILQVLLVDNLIKIRTDFHCSSQGMCVAANLYLLKMIAKEYQIPVIAFTELYSDKALLQPIADSEYIDRMIIFHSGKERVPKPVRADANIFSDGVILPEIPFEIYVGKESIKYV